MGYGDVTPQSYYGKVFAFFTVPTPTAMWTTERDIPSLREQQLIDVLRTCRYHGEWFDAELRVSTMIASFAPVSTIDAGGGSVGPSAWKRA